MCSEEAEIGFSLPGATGRPTTVVGSIIGGIVARRKWRELTIKAPGQCCQESSDSNFQVDR